MIPPQDVWGALFDQALWMEEWYRQERERHGALAGDSVLPRALELYIRDETDDADGVFAGITKSAWMQKIERANSGAIAQRIKWYCDWVEALATRAAFGAFRLNEKSVAPDRVVAGLNTLTTFLEASPDVEASKRQGCFRHHLPEFEAARGQGFAESWKDTNEAWLNAHEAAGKEEPFSLVEMALYTIWPIIRHHEWDMGEVVRLFADHAPDPLKHEAGKFCANLGLHGRVPRGKRGVGRSRECPPRWRLAKAILGIDSPK